MAQAEQCREIKFRVYVGDQKLQKAIVCVYDPCNPDEPIEEVECQKKFGPMSTSEAVSVPSKPLFYRYKVQFESKYSWNTGLVKMVKQLVSSSTFTTEDGFRQLPGAISCCCDIYRPPDTKQEPKTVLVGITKHLQTLVDNVKSSSTLKQTFLQLEHAWRSFDPDILEDDEVRNSLCQWIERTLSTYADQQYMYKLVFLSVLYGKFAELYGEQICKSIKRYAYKNMLQAIENTKQAELTGWCIPSLRITALQILEALDKKHWAFAAVHFPNLFELSRVLTLRPNMNSTEIDISFAEKVMIPRILEGYESDEAQVILQEMPKACTTSDQTTKMTELVRKFTKPRTGFTFDSKYPDKEKETYASKVMATGAWTSSQEQARTARNQAKGLACEASGGTQLQSQHSESDKTLSNTAHGYVSSELEREVFVTFQVLVNDEKQHTSAVYLVLKNTAGQPIHTTEMCTSKVKSDILKNELWLHSEVKIKLPVDRHIFYRYKVSRKIGLIKPTNDELEEDTIRSVSPPKEVRDVFLSPSDSPISERVAKLNAHGAFIYADKLLAAVSAKTLKECLMQTEKDNFLSRNVGNSFARAVTDWIQMRIYPYGDKIPCALSVPQRKFLAIILGKLLNAGYDVSEKCISVECRYVLMETLQVAIAHEFPTSVKNDLGEACLFLVSATDGTWPYVWFYFFNLLDVDTLTNSCRYVLSPRWTVKSWTDDKVLLENVLGKLGNNQMLVDKFLICCLGEIEDHRVLKAILDISDKHSKDDSAVSIKAAGQLNDIIKKRCPKKLDTLVQLEHIMKSTKSPQVIEVVRQHIINFLAVETWSQEDNKVLRCVALDTNVYRTTEELLQVLHNMMNHFEYPYVHRIFIDVLKCPEILKSVSPKTIQELFENAIKTLLLSFRTTRKLDQAIQTIYQLLFITRDCVHIDGHEHLSNRIDGFAYMIIKELSFDTLIDTLCQNKVSALQREELCILAKHLKRRLYEDKQIRREGIALLKKFPHRCGKLCVSSSPIYDVLLAFLDVQEPLRCIPKKGCTKLNFEENISKIIKYGEFWLTIFHSIGDYSDGLRQHKRCREVTALLQHFEDSIIDRNVTIDFERHLLRKNEDVLLQLLQTCAIKDYDINQYKTHLKAIHGLAKQFQDRVDCLNELINSCVDGLSHVAQITNLKKLVYSLRNLQKPEIQRSVFLRDTEQGSFWECLEPLMPIAVQLQSLTSSKMFINVCISVLKGTCQDAYYDVTQETYIQADGQSTPLSEECAMNEEVVVDATREVFCDKSCSEKKEEKENLEDGLRALQTVLNKGQIDASSFANLLKEVCLPIFNQRCQNLLDGNADIPIRMLEIIMAGISSEDLLQLELHKLHNFFDRRIPRNLREALTSFVAFPELSRRSQQLSSVFDIFEVLQDNDDINKALRAIQNLSEKNAQRNLTLQQIHEAPNTVAVLEKDFKPDDWDIIEQLAESRELIAFLRPLVDEDLRNLIDAVEERSEQYVSESTVSDLIDVKRYLGPLLKLEAHQQAKHFVHAIKRNRNLALDVQRIPVKINTCLHYVHSLRDLYNNVANRGEMTKEIITNAQQIGAYSLKMDDEAGRCHVMLKYKRGQSEAIYSLDQLNDIRSRALLIANSQKPQPDFDLQGEDKNLTSPSPDYRYFVKCIDTVNEIVDLCAGLVESGHFSFKTFAENVNGLDQLNSLRNSLQEKFIHWKDILSEARELYYFLNFFHSKQLWQLDQFFIGESVLSDEISLLFRLIDTGLKADLSFREYYVSPSHTNDIKERLFHLGEALQKVAQHHNRLSRGIPGKIKPSTSPLDTKVLRGTLFVAELDEESTKSVPVLLQLYNNTTGLLPEPSQIVFCHSDTSWEEIYILLKRCVGAPTKFDKDKLYSLVNVELLATDLQFQLVNELKQIQEERTDFLLCLICRGGSHHHIIDQFSPHYVHCLHGFTEVEMSSCLRSGWPEMIVVTSSEPGLGKTEYIKTMACQNDLGVHTLPVSGPVKKEDIVKQVKLHAIAHYEVLHIDASPLSNPELFDSFMFEMVVIGMAVSGTHLCMPPTRNIALEIANTQQDKLRNALTICSSFKRKHLVWSNFDNFVISEDINSPVQVVCHYLQALNNNALDKVDIMLTGPNHVKTISSQECRTLLGNFFSTTEGLTYTLIDTFLAILAQELRRMSASMYFMTRNLKDMIGSSGNDVRSKFVEALVDVSKEFTARSVKQTSRDDSILEDASEALRDFRSASAVSASQMVARTQGMVKWTESNHLLVVFHRQDSQTISTLYRLLDQVPANVSKLFETQMRRRLRDYNHMEQDELHSILEKVVRSTRAPFQKEKLEDLQFNYALTPDNLLKMVLIHMRIKSNIPVIIMGETGCGKTTLITYLARVSEVSFDILTLHAGVTESTIIGFVESLIRQAESNLKLEIWGFFDEINTCDHLGILNEVICHRSLQGIPIPTNLFFLAACNPYRLRENEKVTVGLVGSQQRDEMSKLVYRVHPLPETMMNYVWDYGSLSKKDEEAYIRRMLKIREDAFVDLIVMSQEFMRITEGTSYCVSLRDVNRCQHLVNWFLDMFKKRRVEQLSGNQKYCTKPEIRSIILALAHCYHSRLTDAKDRQNYRGQIASILQMRKLWLAKERDIEEMIKVEQLNFLNRMLLPEGTAKNEALRENVFVILVSILNRIPVFVVGKPGCSKSLSMQLIRSNLIGPDSKNDFFKILPPLYVVSYQGSESSTSDGIIKVFEKAMNYKKYKPDVMPVVLLDEIGLAERSRFNPLKVLHSQLEPTIGGFPPVAVVGISNWTLDAAKMNRAIYLCRPEPTVNDLAETAKAIRDEIAHKQTGSSEHQAVSDVKLCGLAEAFSSYQTKQKHRNFHGLRDYYSLVKYVAMQTYRQSHSEAGEIVEKGILRNFGGLKLEMRDIMNTFAEKMNLTQRPEVQPSVMELIQDNLVDKHARHLMLITSGDSALNILEQTLQGQDHVIKFGSRFDNDISEEYNYKVLSEIILCMEQGVTLVLRDLESIYGSLYDMLNQNYRVIGKKRNCRVALGPYSNPMCQVHEEFRCVVLVDEHNVDYQNPPFLNRFEKQTLRFSDILNEVQKEAIHYLQLWMDDISRLEGFQFSPEVMFLGLHGDTLPSLVYHRSCDSDLLVECSPQELALRCQDDLIRVACPDAILRASRSRLATKNRAEVERVQKLYFNLPQQNGLRHFMEGLLSPVQCEPFDAVKCTRQVVYTHSSIHTDIKKCLEGLVTVQVEKLSNFKSEHSFTNQMRHFWFESNAHLLVLHCMASLDSASMLLAKCRVDQCRQKYLNTAQKESIIKHACIIVHIDRTDTTKESHPWQFNFLCGWNQCTLDSLESTSPPLQDILQGPISDLFSGTIDLDVVIKEQILWCFSCIKYEEKARDVESVVHLSTSIANSFEFLNCLRMQIVKYIQASEEKSAGSEVSLVSHDGWQVDVACNFNILYRCSTLTGAMIEYVRNVVRIPLAKTIILLERLCAWTGSPIDTHCTEVAREGVADLWQFCFRNSNMFDIKSKHVPEPRGVESCLVDCNCLDLKFPFFKSFHSKIDSHRDWLLNQDLIKQNYDEENKIHSISHQLMDIIKNMYELHYEDYLKYHLDDYLDDLYTTFAVGYTCNIPIPTCLNAMKWLLQQINPNDDMNADAVEVLAQTYAIIWINGDLLKAELQLLSIYVEVTGDNVQELFDHLQALVSKTTGDVTADDLYGNEGSLSGNVTVVEIENKGPPSIDKEQTGISTDLEEGNSSLESMSVTITTENGASLPDTCQNTEDRSEKSDSRKDTTISTETPYGFKHHTDTSEVIYQDSAQTILVTEICNSVLPVTSVLNSSGGLEGWQRKASLVLLLAGRVSGDSAVLHFLRLCRDFVALLGRDFSITDDQLISLGEIGKDAEDPLAAEEVFQFISETVYELMANEEDRNRITKLEEFLCIYFGLCLEANLDTPFLPQIIEILCKESGELLAGSRPVLLDILKSEIENEEIEVAYEDQDESLSVGERIIFGEEVQDDAFCNLALIDDILRESRTESHLLVACCDIIEDIAFGYITCDLIANTKSDDEQILKTATEAVRIVNCSSGCSLKLVTAIAFLRAFLDSSAELIAVTNVESFKLDGEHFVLAKTLNGLLRVDDTTGKKEDNLLRSYLLKNMREKMSLFRLRKLCSNIVDPMTNLAGIEWQEKLFSTRFGYNPMSYVDHYSEALNALSESHVRKDFSKLVKFIDNARSISKYRLALLAAIADVFYFVQTTRGLRDSDKYHAEWLFEQTEGFHPIFRELVKRMIGLADFDGVLQISDSTDEESLNAVSVIIHLISVIIANADDSLDLSFTQSLDQLFFPGIGVPSPVLTTPYTEHLEFNDCICGHRIVLSGKKSKPCCPMCNRKESAQYSIDIPEHSEPKQNDQKPYTQRDIGGKCSTSTDSCRGLSPASYRAINILLHCGFLAGHSLRLISSSEMKSFLTLSQMATEDNTDLGATAATQGEQMHVTYESPLAEASATESNDESATAAVINCLNRELAEKWRLVQTITRSNHEGVAVLLHCVIRTLESTDANKDCFKSEAARDHLELFLSNVIDNYIQEMPKCKANFKQTCLQSQGIDMKSIEVQLDEIGIVEPSLSKRCLRIKRKPSFSDFQAQFAFEACGKQSTRYPFLQLYLSRHEVIQYVRYLPDLLKWNALVSSILTNRIRRIDAQRITVADFLSDEHYHFDEDAKSSASKSFSAFQKAWNSIRDGWLILTQENPAFGTMTVQNVISQCLVERNEQGSHLQRIITTLRNAQNRFLMDALAIVTHNYCPALNFLLKSEGVAGIQSVSLNSAGPAIIQYKWSDNILLYHDIGTKYGHGSVIRYKFTIIERELARILVLNKAILMEGTIFSKFTCSDELFHACSTILMEIGSIIPQQRLADEIISTIEKEQDRHRAFAQEMLEHLEIILILLKKTGGDPGCSLQDLIKRWDTQLPGHFPEDMLPEPRDSIKLQHIAHLYEMLEDLLVGAVVDNLHDDFRKAISTEVRDMLSQRLKPCSVEKLQQVASTIRRFVFRFIRSSNTVDPEANLKEVMLRSFGNAVHYSVYVDLIPDEVTVGNVVKILQLINKQIEEREAALRKKDVRSNRTRTVAAGRSTGRRRRGGKIGGVS